MQVKWIYGGLAVIFLLCSGCETAKGIKKDAQNTWHNAHGLDAWIKENLW